jgi:hypothetical protein
VLYVIENQRAKWNLFEFKNNVMRHIEISAQCCDTYFVQRVSSEDVETNAWFKMKMVGIAAAIRAKKKLVLMTESEGRERLVNGLRPILVSCALGRWGTLEQQDAETLTLVKRSWYDRVGMIARGLIVGLLPAAGLAAWRLPELQLPEIPASAAQFFTNAVVLWAVVSFLSLLDPESLEKAKAVTEIAKKIP